MVCFLLLIIVFGEHIGLNDRWIRYRNIPWLMLCAIITKKIVPRLQKGNNFAAELIAILLTVVFAAKIKS